MVTHPVAGTGAWRGSRTTVALLRGLTLVTITYLAFRFVLVDYVWSPLRWISDVLSLSLGGLAVLALWRDPAWRRAVWACRPGLRNVLLGLAGAIVLAVVTVLASGLANGRGLVDIATGIRSLVLWCTLLAAVGLVAAWELAYGPGQAQGAGRRPWALRVLSWVVALAVFMALVETAGVLLFGWYGPAEWVATLTGSNAGRAVGLMKNPNTLGCFLVLGLLLLWPRWVAAVTRRVRDRAVWAWAVLLLMGLALTYSRQGWLAVAAGLLAAGWVARRLVPWRVTALLMLVVVVVTVLTTILPVPLFAWGDDDGISRTRQLQLRRISETFDEETVDKSRATGRLAMVRYALAMLRDHPVLGVGPGRVGGAGALNPDEELQVRYGLPDHAYADNQYVRTAMELGTLGLLALGAMILTTLALAYRTARIDPLQGAAFTAVVVAMVSFGLGQNAWENQPLAAVYWLSLGAAWALQLRQER